MCFAISDTLPLGCVDTHKTHGVNNLNSGFTSTNENRLIYAIIIREVSDDTSTQLIRNLD